MTERNRQAPPLSPVPPLPAPLVGLEYRARGETEPADQMRNEAVRRAGIAIARTVGLAVVVLAALIVFGVIVTGLAHTSRQKQARLGAARTDIATLETALDRFQIDTGRYPTAAEGLDALVQAPSGLSDWNGPYLNKIPLDPWGNAYSYAMPSAYASGQENSFDVWSSGANGIDGDEDDVGNWNR